MFDPAEPEFVSYTPPRLSGKTGSPSRKTESHPEEFQDYVPPDWDEFFMRHVYLVASKSKDPRTKIGAVIVKDNNIIASGYNGFARGVLDLPERYDDRETKYLFVCHGEFNAVASAARHGIATNETIMYTQGIPCNECAKSVVQSGIKVVVVHEQWREYSKENPTKWTHLANYSKTMFEESGVAIRYYNKVLHLQGYRDGKLIEV